MYFFRLNSFSIGPVKYFDLIFCFFFTKTALLLLKRVAPPSSLFEEYFDLTITPLHILPLTLNLNLKPLYSTLGGDTTRAEPLIKKPIGVKDLLKPLYKWKVCNQITVVLSDIYNQVCFVIIFFYFLFTQTLTPELVDCCFIKSWERMKKVELSFIKKWGVSS